MPGWARGPRTSARRGQPKPRKFHCRQGISRGTALSLSYKKWSAYQKAATRERTPPGRDVRPSSSCKKPTAARDCAGVGNATET